jgi:Concanavalin A-like lectin/glucanases superfamily
VTWTASGQNGAALTFDGASSRVSTTATVPVGSAFSFTGWLFNPAATGYETIVAHGTGRNVFLQDGRLSFFDGTRDVDLGVNVPAGTWAHVAVTGAGGSVRAYVDGVQAAAVSAGKASGAAAALVIGAWPTGGGYADHFSGRIDEVRWYGRQLSQAEVQADRATPVSGGTPPAPTTTVTTIARTTVAPTTTAPPSGEGSSLRFFGNGNDGIDRVRIPLNSNRSVDVGGDFTIEWWMKVAGPLTNGSCGTAEAGWIFGKSSSTATCTAAGTTATTASQSALPVDGNTVALYHADEGSGTVLDDAAGSNNGALIVGGSPTDPVWSTDSPP